MTSRKIKVISFFFKLTEAFQKHAFSLNNFKGKCTFLPTDYHMRGNENIYIETCDKYSLGRISRIGNMINFINEITA